MKCWGSAQFARLPSQDRHAAQNTRPPATLSQTLVKNLARLGAQRALADLGLYDAAARDDLADLRAALASGRRLRFGLLQQRALLVRAGVDAVSGA